MRFKSSCDWLLPFLLIWLWAQRVCLNETKFAGESYHRTDHLERISVSNQLNLDLFLTQTYFMSSEDLQWHATKQWMIYMGFLELDSSGLTNSRAETPESHKNLNKLKQHVTKINYER